MAKTPDHLRFKNLIEMQNRAINGLGAGTKANVSNYQYWFVKFLENNGFFPSMGTVAKAYPDLESRYGAYVHNWNCRLESEAVYRAASVFAARKI